MTDKYDPSNFKFVMWITESLHLENGEMLFSMHNNGAIAKYSSGFIRLKYIIGDPCEIYTKVRGNKAK
jgi:hypothetical protein